MRSSMWTMRSAACCWHARTPSARAEMLTSYSRSASLPDMRKGVRHLFAARAVAGATGLDITVDGSWGVATLHSRFIGDFNVENLLAALGALLGWNVPFHDAIAALERCSPPPGRMETLIRHRQAARDRRLRTYARCVGESARCRAQARDGQTDLHLRLRRRSRSGQTADHGRGRRAARRSGDRHRRQPAHRGRRRNRRRHRQGIRGAGARV